MLPNVFRHNLSEALKVLKKTKNTLCVVSTVILLVLTYLTRIPELSACVPLLFPEAVLGSSNYMNSNEQT